MRFIDKSNRCAPFDAFVATYRGRLRNDWERFKKVKGGKEVRLQLHRHLWLSQKGLCAYCEQEIPAKTQDDDTSKSHLEHIRRKSRPEYKHLTYQFENIVVSCEGFDLQAVEVSQKKQFCGHFKDIDGTTYDDALFLNPTEIVNIDSYFWYDSEGNIAPNPSKNNTEQAKAVYMIETLGLAHPILIAMRQTQYDLWLEKQTDWTAEQLAKELNENQPLLPAFFSFLVQKIL